MVSRIIQRGCWGGGGGGGEGGQWSGRGRVNTVLQDIKQLKCPVLWARVASSGQSVFITDYFCFSKIPEYTE